MSADGKFLLPVGILAVGFLAVASLAACGQSDAPGESASEPELPTESPSTTPPASSTATSAAPTSTPEPVTDGELTVAPDFTLPSANGSPVTLSELTSEQPVVLVFYPDAGPEWLGMQGDAWDAQWDMTMALAGAILAQLLLRRLHDRSMARHEPGPEGRTA